MFRKLAANDTLHSFLIKDNFENTKAFDSDWRHNESAALRTLTNDRVEMKRILDEAPNFGAFKIIDRQ